MADTKPKPGDVHIDLLEIDMQTGAHWLDPSEKNRDKLDAKLEEIRERNRKKHQAEKFGKKDKALELDTRAGKKTVVELWPEKDEPRAEFMSRCIEGLTKCVGPKKAPRICATKWRKSEKLGKKEIGQAFVARGLDSDEATEACGETCVGCEGANAPFDKGFDPDEPRDEQGRWTSGGSGSGSAEPLSPDEKLLLVSERPSQEKLDSWSKQLNARQEELNQQGETGNREDEQLNGMHLALNAYVQEDDKNLDSGVSGLNSVYDGDGKLLAASFTEVRADVAKIVYFGATDTDAHLKVLDQVTKAFGDKVSSIQVQRWKDDPESIALFAQAGFKETAKQGGLSNLSAVILEKITREAPKNAPSLEHLPVPISISEGTGGDFQTQIAVAFTSIPARALKTMADNGIKIRAGAKLTELKPALKGEHPRGWPAGMTWDTAEGCYDRGAKEVLVTELYRPVGNKEFVPSTRVRGVALHESGHAYDQALDIPSATSNAYASAYEDDVKSMPKEAKRGLKYYLQKGKAGRSETFAETFSWNAGNVGAGRTDIRPFFPRVSKLVKDAMDRGLWLEPIA